MKDVVISLLFAIAAKKAYMRKEKSPYVTMSTMSITSSKFFFKSLFSESVRVGTLMEKMGTRNTQEFDVLYVKYYS